MTVLCDMHAWAAKVHPPSSMTTKQPPFTMDEARVAISPRGGSSPYSSMLIRRLSFSVGDGEAGGAGGEAGGAGGDITHDIIKFAISQLFDIT